MPRPENKYDRRHLQFIQELLRQIDEIYKSATREAAAIGVSIGSFDTERPLDFKDYPLTARRVDRLVKQLGKALEVCMVNGVESEWTLANNKNNELAKRVFGKNVGRLTQAQYRRYFSNNDAAREAFVKRKENGLTLSDRVWKYTDEFKDEIEMGIDLGLRGGLSADQMARDLQQYLQHPDMLFRRVRDEHGILHLSKRAKDYHPGRGVYRSSYKNARRLAATECNTAYRTADHERWQQMDFVVGQEIHLSGNHTCKGKDGKPHEFEDMCDKLQGRYPKDFKFTGWHPHCRCYATSILKTNDEIAEDTRKMLAGEAVDGESVNRVDDVPEGFKTWVNENEGRMEKAKTLPGFLRENSGYVGKIKGNTVNKAQISEAKADIENDLTGLFEKVKRLLSSAEKRLYVAFEPFSPIVSEIMAKLRDKRKKIALFREILEDKRAEILNDTGRAKTVMFPGHKGKGKSSWEAVKRAARFINAQGKDVIFLPEYEGETHEEISADSLILFEGKPVVADFKCPTKHNWNSLQNALDYGFEQAGTIVLYPDEVKIDSGLIMDAVNYLLRNKKHIGNLVLINQYGEIMEITRQEIVKGKLKRKIKGFL